MSEAHGRADDDVIAVRVGDETVVWTGATASLHLLDPVASRIWEAVQQHGVAEAVTALAERYAVPVDRVRTDVQRVVDALAEHGVPAPEAPADAVAAVGVCTPAVGS